jgi:hypothetical protein
VLAIAAVALALAAVAAVESAWSTAVSGAQGFGAETPGGEGRPVVWVTNLNNDGPGSLRDAVSRGNRMVKFRVAGDIALAPLDRRARRGELEVRGAFITIDGASAPPPGITLRNLGLSIEGRHGAHDVVVRGVRVRDAARDGIRVAYGAYNVVLDRVSVHGSGDGNVDITEARNVTVQWSILAEPAGPQKNMLIKYDPGRVTLHHNLFAGAQQRNPQVRMDDAGTAAQETTLDMRNNVVWSWRQGYGTLVWYGPRANVVANYYASRQSPRAEQEKALVIDDGRKSPAARARAYVAENISGDGIELNGRGTEPAPFPAPRLDTQPACEAARLVLQHAGTRPLDEVDRRFVESVALAECQG